MAETKLSAVETVPSKNVGPTRLPIRISERRVILMLLDLAGLIGALVLALTLRADYTLGTELITQHIFWYVSLAAIWFLIADAFDAYNLQVSSKISSILPALLKAVPLTALIHLLMPILSPPWPASWGAFFLFPILALALVAVGRGLYLLVLDQPVFQRRVLIVGAGWAGCTIAKTLEENGNGTYKLIGFADDDPEKLGKPVTWRAGMRGRWGE